MKNKTLLVLTTVGVSSIAAFSLVIPASAAISGRLENREAFTSAVETTYGVTVDQLKQGKEDGKRIYEVLGVSEDEFKSFLETNELKFPVRGHRKIAAGNIAEFLGITADELKADHIAGLSHTEILTKYNKTEDEFITYLKTQLAEKVTNGEISQDRADRMIERIENRSEFRQEKGN